MNDSGYGQKLLYLIKRLVMRYIGDDVGALAAETTYYLILGVIPFLIFMVNSILFFAAPQIHTIIGLLQYLPQDMAVSMEHNIYRILSQRSSIWLIGGLIAAVWSASQGVDVIIRSIDKVFFTDRNKQSWLIVKTKSIVFTLMISFVMILSLGLMVFGNGVVYALDYFFTLPPVYQVWHPVYLPGYLVVRLLPLCAGRKPFLMETHTAGIVYCDTDMVNAHRRVWLLYSADFPHGHHLWVPYWVGRIVYLVPSGIHCYHYGWRIYHGLS